MKIHKKSILLGVAVLLAATIWVVSAENLIDQNGVLGGRILSQNLVTAGTPVKEGTVLASVESITGAAVAARATRDGVVREVLVKPGDIVRVGQVIARIEPAVK
ncbi:MAG: lipoyl domain-containing protein [Negativicutes bacterium]